MRTIHDDISIKGVVLLAQPRVPNYLGIDRTPFEPLLIEEEIEETLIEQSNTAIWRLYPPGWRRSAYKIYEENVVLDEFEEVSLLTNLSAAKQIKELIEPYLGLHDIVQVEIAGLRFKKWTDCKDLKFFGFDVAYLGGDFYSAILNGLILNPHSDLVKHYSQILNSNGLFDDCEQIEAFVNDFKLVVPTEANSEFYAYRLCTP